MAVQLSSEEIDSLFQMFNGKETTLETDFEKSTFLIKSENNEKEIPFNISEFDRALVKANGWVGYAEKNY